MKQVLVFSALILASPVFAAHAVESCTGTAGIAEPHLVLPAAFDSASSGSGNADSDSGNGNGNGNGNAGSGNGNGNGNDNSGNDNGNRNGNNNQGSGLGNSLGNGNAGSGFGNDSGNGVSATAPGPDDYSAEWSSDAPWSEPPGSAGPSDRWDTLWQRLIGRQAPPFQNSPDSPEPGTSLY
jgi:hypothetical protein